MFPESLYLASSSPRRAEILRAVGWPFQLVMGAVDETRQPDEQAVDYVRRLAAAKAAAGALTLDSGLVLGADTGSGRCRRNSGPTARSDDARRMLSLLSGRWHDVMTGVALMRSRK
jgi:septum formation protein